jgi:hypothetical protein
VIRGRGVQGVRVHRGSLSATGGVLGRTGMLEPCTRHVHRGRLTLGMKRFPLCFSAAASWVFSCLQPVTALAEPEALEITAASTGQLPRGKEADGIIGDFLLRNDRVAAVISGNLPLRRANMSTFYGPDGVTPGCLYDLSLRGANNDQITVFCPASQQGAVSWVRTLPKEAEGETAVECVVTAAKGGGIERRHVYRLRDGWQGVRVTTTLSNKTGSVARTTFGDRWTQFLKTGIAPGGITWADAVDPADRCGYAVGPTDDPAGVLKRFPGELQPGESVTYTRFLAVADSPAAAVGVVAAQQGATGQLGGALVDAEGRPVAESAIWLRPQFPVIAPAYVPAKPSSNSADSNGRLAGILYPASDGKFFCNLAPGKYQVTATAPGRPNLERDVECMAGGPVDAEFRFGAASRVVFDIKDETGASIPCKAQFLALPGTDPVNLGPEQRAHGCRDQYHSEKGRFTVPLPSGRYRVVVTRGIEYGHLERDLEVLAGGDVSFSGILPRLVDTGGWVSADYHNHSTPSGDNVCGTADRLINLAAEHIEFAPTTEHNRLDDWRPEIERLGLAPFIQTVPGLECTGNREHLNAFPFEPVPFTQDNGAPQWSADPRIAALTLRRWQKPQPDRWVQINHPDIYGSFFEDPATGEPGTGFTGLVSVIDGYETQNGSGSQLLGGRPFSLGMNKAGEESVVWSREFLWLQMLNQGRRTVAVAVSDAHSVFGNGVGGWRMYLPSTTDNPAGIQWRENIRAAKAGKAYLTTGPFLQVTTAEGAGPGETVLSKGATVVLRIRVQCTDWIDIDRVQVLVNGRPLPEYNFTRSKHPEMFGAGVVKFERPVSIKLREDAHLIVAACSESTTLATGYGSSAQAGMRPFAYHNPLYVDVDGDGFVPNGDPLGFPMPARRPSVAEAKAMLQAAAVK